MAPSLLWLLFSWISVTITFISRYYLFNKLLYVDEEADHSQCAPILLRGQIFHKIYEKSITKWWISTVTLHEHQKWLNATGLCDNHSLTLLYKRQIWLSQRQFGINQCLALQRRFCWCQSHLLHQQELCIRLPVSCALVCLCYGFVWIDVTRWPICFMLGLFCITVTS